MSFNFALQIIELYTTLTENKEFVLSKKSNFFNNNN